MIYALITSFMTWLSWFVSKTIVEKWYNKDLSVFFLWAFNLISLFVIIFLNINFQILTDISSLKEYFWFYLTNTILFLSIAWWIIDFINHKSRLLSLLFLPASLVFVSSRLISSILILIVWAFFYKEALSNAELFWFFLWVFAVSLLYEHKKIKDKSYKTGIIFLIIVTVTIVFWNTIFKENVTVAKEIFLNIDYNNIVVAFFINSLCYLILSSINMFYTKYISKVHISCINIKWNILFSFILSLFHCLWGYLVFMSYNTLDFAIAYKIISYSMFVSIFLSIIFYWEELTKKKVLAFVLTAISILMFY